ncbi:DMT family transporter [Leucobacter sp. M11]|uniref:DMT family transporter n=1 Tax=Leucobacter sp. M11 TaxID=2993565 RepID=UPI002D7FB269|nr:multidrug efflux SMR transporter [Leucobacter sp. M11]MEB4613432.1 multidrug efflux SMR transporter [Leucobacter sp. M11]
MPWFILVISAILEAVWATALGMSEGFTQPVPTVVFLVANVLSMIGLGAAMKHIPISVAYSVWVGIGAALTVAYAMITGVESASPLKIVFLVGIILCVMGLKFAKSPEPKSRAASLDEAPAGSAE